MNVEKLIRKSMNDSYNIGNTDVGISILEVDLKHETLVLRTSFDLHV